MPGSLDLTTPQDLLNKLQHDLERFRNDPNDRYSAFDFLVTAECMLDWQYPGNNFKKKRTDIRDSSPILLALSHLASSLKHFDKLSDHHQSVEDAGVFGAFFGGDFFGGGFFGDKKLMIIFKGTAVDTFGPSMPAIDFAEKVVSYWKSSLDHPCG